MELGKDTRVSQDPQEGLLLGLGHIPWLNKENRELSESLQAKEAEILRARSLQGEAELERRIFDHWNGLEESLAAVRGSRAARKGLVAGERDLAAFNRVRRQRNLRDEAELRKGIDGLIDRNEGLEEDVLAKATINELLEDEHLSDVKTLLQWSSDLDGHEDDIAGLLRYQEEDRVRLKQLHLRLEKGRLKLAGQCREQLDEAASSYRAVAQVALESASREFRALHEERQRAVERWEQAVAVVEKRDSGLQDLVRKIQGAQGKAAEASAELDAQKGFLSNEVRNVGELERHLAAEEAKARKLSAELEARSEELDELDGDTVLERRQTWRIGQEIDSVRSSDLKRAKAEYQAKLAGIEDLRNELKEVRERLKAGGSSAMTAEERADEMERLLVEARKASDSLAWDLDRARAEKVRAEGLLKAAQSQHLANLGRIGGLDQETAGLTKAIKAKAELVAKREELILTLGFSLAQVERELFRLKGLSGGGVGDPASGGGPRSELKAQLEELKAELESRLADKRNLDHLVHKMMADAKKVSAEIAQLGSDEAKVRAQLEQVRVSNESYLRDQRAAQEKAEALLLEEKVARLSESRVARGLDGLHRELLDLQRDDVAVAEELQGRRADLEGQLNLHSTKLRYLGGELSALRGQVRERRSRAQKLRVQFEVMVKAMGEAEKASSGEATEEELLSLPSHAYQLVRLAQEKMELRDQTAGLSQKLAKEEQELAGLEAALALLKQSQEDFRATAVQSLLRERRGEIGGFDSVLEKQRDEEELLRGEVARRQEAVRKLEGNLEAAAAAVDEAKRGLAEAEKQLSGLRLVLDDKDLQLDKLEREMAEMERKVRRAEVVQAGLQKELRASVQNPEFYEQDMNLREEKEKQRGVLIQLKDISGADQAFSTACNQALEALGFGLPSLELIAFASMTNRPLPLWTRGQASAAADSGSADHGNSLFRSGGSGTISRPAASSSGSLTNNELLTGTPKVLLASSSNLPT